MVFVEKILFFQVCHMSAGTSLPSYDEPARNAVMPIAGRRLQEHPEWGRTRLSPSLAADVSAQMIRAALKSGAMDSVEYSDNKK